MTTNLALCRSPLYSETRSATLFAVVACAMLSACGGPREAGPTEDERGSIFYWEVTGSELTYGEECSDSETFRGDLAAPEFEENTFIIYRLEEDGATAVSQNCTTTDASTCSDDTGEDALIFMVSGNELIYDPPGVIDDIANTECDLENDQLWTLTDNGETLTMVLDLQFNHVGEAAICDPIETQLEMDSDNGQGLDGCIVTISADADFDSAQSP